MVGDNPKTESNSYSSFEIKNVKLYKQNFPRLYLLSPIGWTKHNESLYLNPDFIFPILINSSIGFVFSSSSNNYTKDWESDNGNSDDIIV